MERSHTPLSVWFWAAYLVASQTPGMSAVQFQRQLGLTRYETAFGILHKLRAGMVRPDKDRIGGRAKEHVEVDEAWVGGKTRGEGRGVHHKQEGVSEILCAGPGYPSRFDEPVVEHDSELGLGLAPFAWRHFPCLRDLAQDEIQQFDRRLIGWKMTSRSHGAPEFGVQGFDGVRNRYEDCRRRSPGCGRRACGVWCDHPGRRRREHESVGRPMYSMS
jgi:hypothetical protein